jgi:N-acetylglutamate synthase-like GNAT family acetyltransferase
VQPERENDLTIRECTESDLDDVRRLYIQLTGRETSQKTVEERFEYFRRSAVEFLFVAEKRGKVAGLCGFRIRENVEDDTRYGEISVLVVDESIRRQGIAAQFVKFAESLAREKECIGLWLVSGFGREEYAHEFYKQQGFTVNGYRFVKTFKQE